MGLLAQREMRRGVGGAVLETATMVYDHAGRLTQKTGFDGLVWDYTHSPAGLSSVTANSDPATPSWSYQYTSTGQLRRVTPPAGALREFTYDALDRQTAEEWLDGGEKSLRNRVTYDGAQVEVTQVKVDLGGRERTPR